MVTKMGYKYLSFVDKGVRGVNLKISVFTWKIYILYCVFLKNELYCPALDYFPLIQFKFKVTTVF